MPKLTKNYNLKKPLYSDNADIAVINQSLDALDEILTPQVSAITPPELTENKGKLAVVLGWIANRIKAITGKSSWQLPPSVTLEECGNHIQSGTHSNATTTSSGFMSVSDKQKLDGATSEGTSSKLMQRDSAGRAKVQSPASSLDITNKQYVDDNFVAKKTDTTMAAKLTAQSNTSYSTKQVRNIVIWSSGSTPPSTGNGDIVIKTF